MPTVRDAIIELLELPMDEEISISVATASLVKSYNLVNYHDSGQLTDDEIATVVRNHHLHSMEDIGNSLRDLIDTILENR